MPSRWMHAAAKTQKGLRIFVRDTKPLEFHRTAAAACRKPLRRAVRPRACRQSRCPRLRAAPMATSRWSIMLDLQTEVEMKLPGRFKVSPQIAGAIKAVSGVVDVQTL